MTKQQFFSYCLSTYSTSPDYPFEGDFKTAAQLQLKYLRLMNGLFMQVNPIPVKTAMAKMGYCLNEFRMPLCPMEASDDEKLFALMREQNLIK